MDAITIFPSIINLSNSVVSPLATHTQNCLTKIINFQSYCYQDLLFFAVLERRIYVSSFREGKHGYEEEKWREINDRQILCGMGIKLRRLTGVSAW